MTVGFERITRWDEAVCEAGSDAAVVAGGTELIPLMRAGIIRPRRIFDIGLLDLRHITVVPGETLSIGALATMADVAAHPSVRALTPAISQALWESASPQVRNMATLGGNLMQRTRCSFFRDPVFPCNRRMPGSGCPANDRGNRYHAVLGSSEHCRAVNASDLATALSALNALVKIRGRNGSLREIGIDALYTAPNDAPHRETVLQPNELITEITIPLSEAARNSIFVKLRDRASFEFAVVSVAVAAAVRSDIVQDIRVAVGGVAYKPWRLDHVERRLCGRAVDPAKIQSALADFGDSAEPLSDSRYKVDLARALVARAIGDATSVR